MAVKPRLSWRVPLLSALGLSLVGMLATAHLIGVAAAQTTGLGLTVTPPVSYLRLQPGEKAIHQITISNHGSTALTVTPSLHSFSTPDGTNRIQIESTHDFPYLRVASQAAGNRLRMGDGYTLPPGSQADLDLVIDVPESAATTEYHLTTLFSAQAIQNSPAEAIGAILQGSIGSNLIVTIGGKNQPPESLALLGIKSSRVVDSFGQLEFIPLVSNPASQAQQATGSAELLNWRGQVVATYQVYPDVVLANDQRQLRRQLLASAAATVAEPAGFSYRSHALFGPYRFRLTLYKPNTSLDTTLTTISTQEVTSWAVPWRVGLILLLGGLIWFGYQFMVSSKLPIGKDK